MLCSIDDGAIGISRDGVLDVCDEVVENCVMDIAVDQGVSKQNVLLVKGAR